MMTWKIWSVAYLFSCSILLIPPFFTKKSDEPSTNFFKNATLCYTPKGCVFRTIHGEESSDNHKIYHTSEKVDIAIEQGLDWIVKAQQSSGGWGAGSHNRQDILDPHAVPSDPATTAMVGMALMRTGTRLNSGVHAHRFQKALNFLLNEVESTPEDRTKITDLANTQIQSKLGNNIDAVLTLQFLSNLMEYLDEGSSLKERVMNSINICTQKIQNTQNNDGSFQGAGWAGVLQSAFANNALESARYYGADVDEEVLDKSREYQKSNYDAESGNVDTSKGAGITLYSVSGSVRASAKQARKVKEAVRQARQEGRLSDEEPVTTESLMEIGFADDEALKLSTSYQVYESSKKAAQRNDVMEGFGNNGGEEFLSYLQTGESLIINQDDEWQNWYKNVSGRLINIQNEDGSWNGHHCITSPVFCTATTLLTLSIQNDVERLIQMGDVD